MNALIDFLNGSYTAYQAVENAEALLKNNGFIKLKEQEEWRLQPNGRYYVVRGGSSLVAFKTNLTDKLYFKLVCSHVDSPCLKLKENPEINGEVYVKLNTETYGGGIWYSFFDRPLKIAGRLVVREGNALKSENTVSYFNVTIPSLAAHMNRGVNDGFSVNPQVDLLPIAGLSGTKNVVESLSEKEIVSHDLFVVPAEEPFYSGLNNEFLSSPRIDNLTSVYASLLSLIASEGDGITAACCFDNEEIGSRTLQGAGSDFLSSVLKKISLSLGFTLEETARSFTKSVSVSLDNAHAVHPNHGEKSDLTNRPVPGGGIVVKGHAGKAYTTDARSSAFIKTLFQKSGTKYQTFFNRSGMRSGSTLGGISLGQIGILTVDLGLAQLAMHAAVECFAVEDYKNLLKGLVSYYDASVDIDEDEIAF